MNISIRQIKKKTELKKVVPLFDLYRQFYEQSSDIQNAQVFLEQLFTNQAAVIFAAYNTKQQVVGFTQLYPLYSSVAMCKHWLLNDLYVDDTARGHGVASSLLKAAQQFAISDGADRLILKTHKNNDKANRLYQNYGYELDTTFNHYTLRLL